MEPTNERSFQDSRRWMTSRNTKIRIGPKYQAQLPELISSSTASQFSQPSVFSSSFCTSSIGSSNPHINRVYLPSKLTEKMIDSLNFNGVADVTKGIQDSKYYGAAEGQHVFNTDSSSTSFIPADSLFDCITGDGEHSNYVETLCEHDPCMNIHENVSTKIRHSGVKLDGIVSSLDCRTDIQCQGRKKAEKNMNKLRDKNSNIRRIQTNILDNNSKEQAEEYSVFPESKKSFVTASCVKDSITGLFESSTTINRSTSPTKHCKSINSGDIEISGYVTGKTSDNDAKNLLMENCKRKVTCENAEEHSSVKIVKCNDSDAEKIINRIIIHFLYIRTIGCKYWHAIAEFGIHHC